MRRGLLEVYGLGLQCCLPSYTMARAKQWPGDDRPNVCSLSTTFTASLLTDGAKLRVSSVVLKVTAHWSFPAG